MESKYSFLRTALLSGQNTNTNNRYQTHLLSILLYTNSILTLKISHSEFHPSNFSYHLLLGPYDFLPGSVILLDANVRTAR